MDMGPGIWREMVGNVGDGDRCGRAMVGRRRCYPSVMFTDACTGSESIRHSEGTHGPRPWRMVNERKSPNPGRAWHADGARPPAQPRRDAVLAGDGQACTDSLSDEHGWCAAGARHRSTLIPLCPSWHWKVDGRWYEVDLTTGLHIPPTRALQVVQCGRLQPTTDCLVQLSRLAVGVRAHGKAEFALRLSGMGYGAR